MCAYFMSFQYVQMFSPTPTFSDHGVHALLRRVAVFAVNAFWRANECPSDTLKRYNPLPLPLPLPSTPTLCPMPHAHTDLAMDLCRQVHGLGRTPLPCTMPLLRNGLVLTYNTQPLAVPRDGPVAQAAAGLGLMR